MRSSRNRGDRGLLYLCHAARRLSKRTGREIGNLLGAARAAQQIGMPDLW